GTALFDRLSCGRRWDTCAGLGKRRDCHRADGSRARLNCQLSTVIKWYFYHILRAVHFHGLYRLTLAFRAAVLCSPDDGERLVPRGAPARLPVSRRLFLQPGRACAI